MSLKNALIPLLIAPTLAWAGPETRVHIAMDAGPRWAEGDNLCVEQGGRELGCNRVSVTSKGEAQLLVPDRDRVIRPGVRLGIYRDESRERAPRVVSYVVDERSRAVVTRPTPRNESAECAFHSHDLLTVTPRLFVERLHSTDLNTGGAATLNSAFGTSLEVRLAAVRLRDSALHLSFDADFLALSAPPDRTIASTGLTRFGAGADYDFHPFGATALLVGVSAGLQQEILYRATSVSVLAADRVALPRVGVSAAYALLGARAFSLSLELRGSHYFPASEGAQTVRNGDEVAGGLTGRWPVGSLQMSASVDAGERSLTTALESQSATFFGLRLGVGFGN